MPKLPRGIFRRAGRRGFYIRVYRAGVDRAIKAGDTVEEAKALAGQLVLVPLQVSATSQAPAVARQSVPAVFTGWVQLPLASQTSSLQPSPSSAQAAPGVLSQALVVSLHVVAQPPPAPQGLPACALQVLLAQVSAPLQKRPSSQATVVVGAWPMHWPTWLQTSPVVQTLLSLHEMFVPPTYWQLNLQQVLS